MAVTEVAGVGHGVGFKPVKDDAPSADLSFTTPIKISDEDADALLDSIAARVEANERRRPIVPVAQHHSAGKPKFGLVPPRALEQMAIVMTQAEAKYPPQGHTPNYLIGNGFDPRDYIESALRHLNACVRGEQLNDTGMHHLAHAAIDAAIALELMYHRKEIT